jgi:hypothetical protein
MVKQQPKNGFDSAGVASAQQCLREKLSGPLFVQILNTEPEPLKPLTQFTEKPELKPTCLPGVASLA